MAIYVVDTSVLIQAFIAQTYTVQATALLNRLAEGDQIHVPEFCLIECANVLWKEVRFRGLLQTEAEQLMNGLLALSLEIAPIANLLPRSLQLGLTHQLPIYDSLYIALALDLNCPLITVDDRQATAAGASGATIKPMTDFT